MFNVVISNVPGPKVTLYLNTVRLNEVYPVSIATHYLALNITISGYRDALDFGYTACRRSVPALQRMLDYTDEAIAELETALQLGTSDPFVRGKTANKPRTRAPRKRAVTPSPASATPGAAVKPRRVAAGKRAAAAANAAKSA